MPIIPGLRILPQENWNKFEASLDYIAETLPALPYMQHPAPKQPTKLQTKMPQ